MGDHSNPQPSVVSKGKLSCRRFHNRLIPIYMGLMHNNFSLTRGWRGGTGWHKKANFIMSGWSVQFSSVGRITSASDVCWTPVDPYYKDTFGVYKEFSVFRFLVQSSPQVSVHPKCNFSISIWITRVANKMVKLTKFGQPPTLLWYPLSGSVSDWTGFWSWVMVPYPSIQLFLTASRWPAFLVPPSPPPPPPRPLSLPQPTVSPNVYQMSTASLLWIFCCCSMELL